MSFLSITFLLSEKEFRAFELLRSGLDRSKYLLVKEAKIIAMTCTHAALKRHDLVELGFKVDFCQFKNTFPIIWLYFVWMQLVYLLKLHQAVPFFISMTTS